jgi:two-component system cell cycle response regulator
MAPSDTQAPPEEDVGDTLVTEFDTDSERPGYRESFLTVLRGPEPGREYVLKAATYEIGRDPEADIPIADAGLSRRHARINRTALGEYVSDMGSTNGTRVNGRPLDGYHPLAEADRIALGEKTILRFGRRDRLEQQAARRQYELIVRDGLTGLYNRRYLDDRLPGQFAYAVRHDVDLCVLMLDVDLFKEINDARGHQAGDEALRGLGEVLQKTVRREDILARYGGEEFAIVALGIDHNGGLAFAERLRSRVESMQLSWKGEPLPITISVGVAHNRTSGQTTVEGLFAAADAALYEAKRGGRNRVVGADA